MTKKDYEQIAGIIAKLPRNTSKVNVAVEFVKEFNMAPNFDTNKFMVACLLRPKVGAK